jgi:hypothetical protein
MSEGRAGAEARDVPPGPAPSGPGGLAGRLAAYPRLAVGGLMGLSTLAVYLPFLPSLEQVFRYWDGPLYLFVAKTLYVVPPDQPFVVLGLPPKYFASHLPLYPLLIRGLTLFTLGSYPLAMLVATLATSIASALLFLRVLESWGLVSSPLWTAALFCFLPPRWVIYHSVGASEPLFLCFVFAALLSFKGGRHLGVVAFVALASLTRITGVLLGPVFGLLYLQRRDWRRLGLLPLSGLGILVLFAFYSFVYGDFFAYSRWNIDRLQILSPLPFQGLRDAAAAGNYRAAELYFWLYVIYGLGLLALWNKREIFIYAFVFYVFGAFVVHRDLTRYMVAVAPFALLVGFDSLLSRPACRPILAVVVYLDYAYAWRSIPRNLAPHRVWEGLLELLAR